MFEFVLKVPKTFRKTKKLPGLSSFCTGGATRTPDTWFWRPVLYQLSYTRIRFACANIVICFSQPRKNSGRDRKNLNEKGHFSITAALTFS